MTPLTLFLSRLADEELDDGIEDELDEVDDADDELLLWPAPFDAFELITLFINNKIEIFWPIKKN